MATLMHKDLNSDHRFGSVYITNTMVETIRVKIGVSFLTN